MTAYDLAEGLARSTGLYKYNFPEATVSHCARVSALVLRALKEINTTQFAYMNTESGRGPCRRAHLAPGAGKG